MPGRLGDPSSALSPAGIPALGDPGEIFPGSGFWGGSYRALLCSGLSCLGGSAWALLSGRALRLCGYPLAEERFRRRGSGGLLLMRGARESSSRASGARPLRVDQLASGESTRSEPEGSRVGFCGVSRGHKISSEER